MLANSSGFIFIRRIKIHRKLWGRLERCLAYSQNHLGLRVQRTNVLFRHRVTVFKQRASRLASLNERLMGIRVGDFWYVHSYQSYLWNHAASTRVQIYGTEQVVLGDLVYHKDNAAGNGKGFVGLDCSDSRNNGDNSSNEDEEMDVHEESNSHVKVMTSEDLRAGCYTIDDAILPMPGSRVVYPTNAVAQVYHDLAKKDAISLTDSVHYVKEFSITSVTGSYRRIFQKPINFEWELLTYTDSSKPLAETDLDKIGKTQPIDKFKPVNAPVGEKEESLDCIRQSETSDDCAKLEIASDDTPGDEV